MVIYGRYDNRPDQLERLSAHSSDQKPNTDHRPQPYKIAISA
ncbi:hypothetical protein AO381_0682 [Moraxella catarrhalis]|nr:hypothetical protein AO381_0682 [Moraxella catarrhalis]